MPASTTAHRTKRPFQPPITSYFSRGDYTTSGADRDPLISPPLPVEIQSSLLNVGMRVRKSVPEGYKTHKTLPTSTLPSTIAGSQQPPIVSSRPAELTPFCGLHKIGGLSQEFNFSQESTASSISHPSQPTVPAALHPFSFQQPTNVRKRMMDDEENEDPEEAFDDALLAEFEISSTAAGRKIQPMRSRQRVGGTNAAPLGQAAGVEDFEEAEFLRPRDVEMGDL